MYVCVIIEKGGVFMFEYIKGKISVIGADYVVVENRGIGYKIMMATPSIDTLTQAEEATVYTHLIVRDDDLSLCGFSTEDERRIFQMLLSVSGIGVKVALSALSTLGPYDLMAVIGSGDDKSLTRIPGVGKKTAQRVILELKDKIKTVNKINPQGAVLGTNVNLKDSPLRSAIDALMALGYTQEESRRALSDAPKEDMSTEDLIKFALKTIVKEGL